MHGRSWTDSVLLPNHRLHPITFELAINLKSLGLTVPPSIMLRTNEVDE
jgi:hypothetical protein